MIPNPLHFSCYWNLDGKWNPTAPEGMRIWAEKLREFENDKVPYTWYGKMSFSSLGIPPKIEELNRRIREQNDSDIETRLYLYTFYEFNGMRVPYSLHVAKVLELRDQRVYEDPDEQAHIPLEFYETMRGGHQTLRGRWGDGQAIPFFFKIADLRELNISDGHKLLKAIEKTNFDFEQFRWDDTTSPAYVREKPQFPNWFDGKTQWWREVLKTGDDLDPGKFRTNAVKDVYYQALQYAAINRPILIVGQRGTGKTHLARFIRRNSRYCKGKYSEAWPLISCGDYGDAADVKSEIFGNQESLSGETLVLDDIEYVPDFLLRKVLNKFEQGAKHESSTDPSTKTFRLIACTSLPPYELHQRLDTRFLDATAAILELPPLTKFEPEDRVTAWDHQYEQVKRDLFPNETIPVMTAEEREEFLKTLHSHPLTGNFRDLKRLATRILLELKFRETISDRNMWPDLKADKIFRETLCTPHTDVTTDQENAETLAWWFLNDRPLEDAFKITDFEELKDLVSNLTVKVRSYLARQVRRLAESGHEDTKENAKKIMELSPSTISRWLNEDTSEKKRGRTRDN